MKISRRVLIIRLTAVILILMLACRSAPVKSNQVQPAENISLKRQIIILKAVKYIVGIQAEITKISKDSESIGIRIQPITGTGILLNKNGWVLTAAHNVENASRIKIFLKDENYKKSDADNYEYNINIYENIIIWDREDLALLKIKNFKELKNPNYPDFDNSIPQCGEDITVFGYLALNSEFVFYVDEGIVSNSFVVLKDEFFRQQPKLLLSRGSVSYGTSGGPVINLDGKVIGIAVALSNSGHGIAIPSWMILKFLEENKDFLER